MDARVRELDWGSTPLGPASTWSTSLRMMVSFLLANRFPLLLWWGPDYIQIYNDAYRPILGAKHPQFLGRPVHECWSEIWHILKPLIDTPYFGGPATWMEDIELEVRRHGYPEESHFTIAYSPVPDESAQRGIGGVLATVHEITEQVIGRRRVGILGDLGARVVDAKTADHACQITAETLAPHSKDIPFALMYLLEPGGTRLRYVCRAGPAPTPGSADPASPTLIDLESEAGSSPWPLARAIRTDAPQIVFDRATLRTLERNPAAPAMAVVVPINSNVAHRPAGALVLGVSSRIPLNSEYLSFLNLLASQVATAVANACAHEAERKRAEALAEIDRAKTTFFSNISHEFRTPLTLMLGPLDEASAKARIPAVRTQIEIVRRNSLRLLKLVNTLLDFSRIEAGRIHACYEPVDLALLTRDLASTFRSAMERAGLRFDVECEDFGEPVYVDREMWEKIVLNLLSNAFKFTLQGTVSVRLYRQGGAAVLEVADTGIGVPEHEIPRLFERFHRVEGAAGRTQEGSGIGLALVQELVKLHGATVEVESALGVGTTFRARLRFGSAHLPADRLRCARPVSSNEIAAEAFVQEALRWAPDEANGFPSAAAVSCVSADSFGDHRFAATFGARIVLVDDNADMRAYVQNLLRPAYAVETATNGEEALVAIRRQMPDLILSDVMMPRLDGCGLIKALRGEPSLRDIPVILISARAGHESRIEGLGAGADDYLVKPFSARELLARVGSLIELTRLRKESAERYRAVMNEFLAMLAHELRNPLAPIGHASELLSRTLRDDVAAQKPLAVVRRQVKQLSRLVDDLLDVSRITQGRIQLELRPLELADVVAQALETVDPQIREKTQRVTLTCVHQPLYVKGDFARLVQCIGNVVANAAKYSDRGAEIHITIRAEEATAVVEVCDTGAGMSAELLPRIFDLFVQSDRTLDRSQGGLGIGLCVVKRLIEMHTGEVIARSPGLGLGSTFEIRLPRIDQPEELRSDGDLLNIAPRRILIVDDNADAADVLALLLNAVGHHTEVVYSAAQAISRIETVNPDVALVDIGLPDLNGYELARQLRSRPGLPRVKLVALTGYGQVEDRQRALQAGFEDHLVKPVELRSVQRALA